MRFIPLSWFRSLVCASLIVSATQVSADAAGDAALKILGGILGNALLQEQQSKQSQPRSNGSIAQDQPAGVAPARPNQPRMTSDQELAVQSALADMGFYDGEVDGDLGPKSRGAIAEWQSRMGAEATGYLTKDQMLNLVALAPRPVPLDGSGQAKPLLAGAVPMESVGDFFDYTNSSAAAQPMRDDLLRALMLRAVKVNPALADDVRRLDWAIDLFSRDPDGPNDMVRAAALVGTRSEFDIRAGHDLASNWLRANQTSAPIQVTRVVLAQLGPYDGASNAFPLTNPDRYGFAETMLFGDFAAATEAIAPAWLGVPRLPMGQEAAQALAARLRPDGGYVVIAVRMNLSGFRLKESFGTVADAKIERISIHDRVPGDPARLGTVIAELPAPGNGGVEPLASIGDASSALESWARLGAPIVEDRVVISNFDTASDMALALLGLSNLPPDQADINVASYYGSRMLPPEQAAALFRTADYSRGGLFQIDQFTKRDIEAEFREKIMPGLIARAPQMPVAMRIPMQGYILAYDFESGSFPLDSPLVVTSDPLRLGRGGVRSASSDAAVIIINQTGDRVVTDIAGIADRIVASEAEARAMSQRFTEEFGNGGSFQVYLAVDLVVNGFGQLPVSADPVRTTDPTGGGNRGIASVLAGTVTRVGLYADQALTQPLAEIPVVMALAPTPPPPPVGQPIPEGVRLTDWMLAGFALESGLSEAQMRDKLMKRAKHDGVSEFDRESVVSATIAEFRAGLPKPDVPIYLSARIGLGEHDGSTGFAIDTMDVGYFTEDGHNLGYEPLQIFFDNPDALKRFPIAPEPAKTLVTPSEKNASGRAFDALVQVTPIRSRAIGDERTLFAMDLRADRILFLSPEDPARVIAIAELARSQEDTAPSQMNLENLALEVTPDRLVLNPEVVTLIQIKMSEMPPSDDMLRILLRARWEIETKQSEQAEYGNVETVYGPSSPWGRYFPAGTRPLTPEDETRLLPGFAQWTALRLETLPKKLTYEAIDQIQGGTYSNPAEMPKPETLTLLGETNFPNVYIFEFLNGPEPTTHDLVLAFDGLEGTSEGLAFRLPPVPTPQGRIPSGAAVSVDFDIISAKPAAQSGAALPVAILEVQPTEVRWWSDRTSSTGRTLLASSPVVPAEPIAEPTSVGTETDDAPVPTSAADVIGVTLGQTLAEAEAVIGAHMSVAHVMESRQQTQSATIIGEMARLYVSADGTDFISVLYGPSDHPPKVFGVARSLFLPQATLDEASLGNTLEGKYGPPQERGDAVGRAWRWIFFPPQDPQCGNVGDQAWINWTGQTVLKGPALDVKALSAGAVAADKSNLGSVLGLRRMQHVDFGIGFPSGANIAGCGPQLTATLMPQVSASLSGEFLPEGDAQVLSIRLFDHKTHFEAMSEASRAFAPIKKAPDVKL